MARGRELEPMVLKMVNLRLMENMEPAIIKSITHPYLVAQIDGLSDTTQCEIKVAATENSYLKTVAQIPIDYQYQMQHQMLVSGRTSVEFVCYHETCGLSVQTYRRDPEMQSKVIIAAQQLIEDLESIRRSNERRKQNHQHH